MTDSRMLCRLSRKVILIYNSAGALAIPQLNVGISGASKVGSLRREDGLRVSCSILPRRQVPTTYARSGSF